MSEVHLPTGRLYASLVLMLTDYISDLVQFFHSTADEPGLAKDFFEQFVQQDPVSVRAKLAFVTGFPALLNAHSQSPKSSEVIKNLQSSGAAALKKAEAEDKKKRAKRGGFSLLPRRNSEAAAPVEKGLWDGLAPSFYAVAERMLLSWKGRTDFKIDQSRGKFKMQVDSLLVTQSETKIQEEVAATVLIVFYLLVLLIVSLPPAMIKRGKRVVAIVKRKIKKIQVAMKRTVSCTSLCTTSLMSSKLPYRRSIHVINAMT
jgi:hypothetical protein